MSGRSFLLSNKIAFSKINLGKFFYNMYNNYTKFLILQFAGSLQNISMYTEVKAYIKGWKNVDSNKKTCRIRSL